MKWNFPSNNHGQITGINDSGVETFKGNPYGSLAREICQNSLDAVLDDKLEVIVEFKKFQLESNDFPDYSGLKLYMQKAKRFWQDALEDKKTSYFFEKGIETLNQRKINCLRVSDFNTKGLSGINQKINSPWLNLIKSTGVSDKKGTSGGSFGIGKFAPFVTSKLNTVFYSTINTDKEAGFQGISRLTSFYLDESENDIASGIGYYGSSNNSAIPYSKSLDKNYSRSSNETGTDIFIMGFDTEKDSNWETSILNSILDGFLTAIYNKKLKIFINDLEVSHSTLETVLKENSQNLNKEINYFYRVLSSKDTVWKKINFMKMGNINFGILKNDEFNHKIAMIRKNGMKIFNQTMKTGFMNYNAVLLIEGNQINAFLRSIENPQHTKWEPQRHTNPKYARSVIKNLNKTLQDILNSMNNWDEIDSIDPKVGGYLTIGGNDEVREESLPTDIKEIEVRKRSKLPRIENKIPQRTEGEMPVSDCGEENVILSDVEESPENLTGGDGSKGSNRTPRISSKKDIEAKRAEYLVQIENVRIFSLNKQEGTYLIQFVSDKNYDNLEMSLNVIGETQKFQAPIITAYNLKNNIKYDIADNSIYPIKSTKNIQNRIVISIDHDEYSPMEVLLYERK